MLVEEANYRSPYVIRNRKVPRLATQLKLNQEKKDLNCDIDKMGDVELLRISEQRTNTQKEASEDDVIENGEKRKTKEKNKVLRIIIGIVKA
jgi:hypothetical protein